MHLPWGAGVTRVAERFLRWLTNAPAGSRYTYHIGHLARDRVGADGAMPVPGIDDVARAAWEAAEAGFCHLLQTRSTLGYYVYQAERTEELSE